MSADGSHVRKRPSSWPNSPSVRPSRSLAAAIFPQASPTTSGRYRSLSRRLTRLLTSVGPLGRLAGERMSGSSVQVHYDCSQVRIVFLKRSNSSPEFAKLRFNRRQPLRVSPRYHVALRIPDEERTSLLRNHKLVLAQLPECVLHRLRGYPVIGRELANRGQPLPRAKLALADSLPQVLGGLTERRPRVVLIDLHSSSLGGPQISVITQAVAY